MPHGNVAAKCNLQMPPRAGQRIRDLSQNSMHKGEHCGLQGNNTLCNLWSWAGVGNSFYTNLYLDLLHLAISELSPKLLGLTDFKKNPSKFWSTGSYSRELHIRLRILTSCWTCTKEALLDKAYAQSGICASRRLFSSKTVKQGRTSQCRHDLLCIAYQNV